MSIPLSYKFISVYWNIFCVIFTSILCISVLYFYCLCFKCMALYTRTTETIYWLFLHPLDTFLYMEFWEINKYKYKYKYKYWNKIVISKLSDAVTLEHCQTWYDDTFSPSTGWRLYTILPTYKITLQNLKKKWLYLKNNFGSELNVNS